MPNKAAAALNNAKTAKTKKIKTISNKTIKIHNQILQSFYLIKTDYTNDNQMMMMMMIMSSKYLFFKLNLTVYFIFT